MSLRDLRHATESALGLRENGLLDFKIVLRKAATHHAMSSQASAQAPAASAESTAASSIEAGRRETLETPRSRPPLTGAASEAVNPPAGLSGAASSPAAAKPAAKPAAAPAAAPAAKPVAAPAAKPAAKPAAEAAAKPAAAPAPASRTRRGAAPSPAVAAAAAAATPGPAVSAPLASPSGKFAGRKAIGKRVRLFWSLERPPQWFEGNVRQYVEMTPRSRFTSSLGEVDLWRRALPLIGTPRSPTS